MLILKFPLVVLLGVIFLSTSNFGIKTRFSFANSWGVLEVLPFKEQEILDATMPIGTSKITTTGHKGYKVKSYRVTTENGVVVEKKYISTDTYSPVAQVKRVGTATN